MTVKVTALVPAATVAVAGAVTVDESVVRAIEAPPVGAEIVSPAVQLAEAPGNSVTGLQDSWESWGPVGAAIWMIATAFEDPRVAVMAALCGAAELEAVAVKVVDADPAGTSTEAGMVNGAEPAESATVAPPVGAAAESVTVQVDEAPGAIELGTQFKAVICKGVPVAVKVPPVPLDASALASCATAITLDTPTAAEPEKPADVVSVMFSITPSASPLELMPASMQVVWPGEF